MRLLKKLIHRDIDKIEGNIYERKAARAVVLDGDEILLLYTKRYNDYSFPGGGIDLNEDIKEGLVRELQEETGARNIKILKEYGVIDEYRSCYYEGFDLMHMTSYFYICKVDKELGETQLEDYEIKNGSAPVWVNIHEAIKHNKKVISEKEDSMGLSIERETFALELVAKEILKNF